jgi:hypothetical protein
VKLIFIHGPAAYGKLTVGRALSALTGIELFHNHLVVDALLEKFRFGDPQFVALRESMWMAVFESAVRQGKSLIFTFQPEPTVAPGFPGRVVDLVAGAGGKVCFIRLQVSITEQERRIDQASRREFRKLTSLTLLRQLRASFDACDAAMPAADLVIDTEAADPATAARRIATVFALPAAPAAL